MSLPRYPEYKDSRVPWLGELPAHWGVFPLKRLLDIQNGADYKHIEAEDGYPVLGSGGQFTFATDYIYDGESVLLGRKGTIDRPLHVKGRFWTVDTMYWSRVRPGVCGRFCYYAATTIPFGLYSTNTALPSMTKGALDAHFVAAPPLEEQRSIAAFLDRETAKIDAAIAEQERLLTLLAEKRQAAISHAVTRGLDPNARMKDSGIPWLGEVPAHWTIRSIKSLAKQDGSIFIDGDWIESRNLSDDGIRYVTTGNVGVGDYKEQGSGFISNTTFADLGCTEVLAGDILISRLNLPIGRACVLPDLGMRVVTSVDNVILRADDDVDRDYLVYRFSAADYLHETANLASGATMQRISRTELGAMRVALPPREEQRSIANHLAREVNGIDTLTVEAERSVVLLRERRNALIAAAVTGQIDVRGAVESQAA